MQFASDQLGKNPCEPVKSALSAVYGSEERLDSVAAASASSAVDFRNCSRKTAKDAEDAEECFAGNTLIHHYPQFA